MSKPARRVALVTGAAKGIGLATAEGLARQGMKVWLSARDERKVREAARGLQERGLAVVPLVLDVTDDAQAASAVAAIEREDGRLDVLVNNAAVLLDEGRRAVDLDVETLRTTLETNLFGPLRLCRTVLPGMRRRRHGRIVNVSSTAGSFADMSAPGAFDDFDASAYSVSKAALNALTVLLARDVRGENVLVNSMCPGWVRTDMGGQRAPLSPEQGADTALFLATLPDGGPTGGFFFERKPHPW